MENAICVKGITKTYKEFKLDNVSFSLPSGSIMGFIGENGAGKSTTIKAILNLICCESGEVQLLGMNSIKDEKSIKEQVGVVFEESNFHDNLKVIDISKIMGMVYTNWDNELFYSYLKKFKLPEKKIVKEFSRGMKMKLNIAVALSHHPKILILDEATSGLDPIIREEILDIFLEFIQDEEHSILVSSHITSDLDKIADYITFIHEGKIVFSESKLDLVDKMGIVKCGSDEFNRLNKNDIVRYRKGEYGYEVLIQNKNKFMINHHNIVVDPVSVEQIMLFYVRGEK
ncbi:MAG: ABC transporter ATP-binding protein [Oscillospiraceae bacterium]